MSSASSHPDAGKYFRINIDDGKSQAGYDQFIHGKPMRLIDWASAIYQDDAYTERHKEGAISFFVHRCFPNLQLTSSVPIDSGYLTGVVYGTISTAYDGKSKEQLVLLKESELMDTVE